MWVERGRFLDECNVLASVTVMGKIRAPDLRGEASSAD